MIKVHDKNIQNIFEKKIILLFLNVQTTKNFWNLFLGLTQTEYYLVGPKIIVMALYYIFLQTINSLLPPLTSQNQ